MFFSDNSLKDNVRYTAGYDDWNKCRDHFAVLNNVINKHYPQYRMNIEQDLKWFNKIIEGYQFWLLKTYIKGELSDRLGRCTREEFLLLTLEDYLEKNSFIKDLKIVVDINAFLPDADSCDIADAERVYYKMKLATAINRANIYQRSDVDWFTQDIIDNLD